MNTNARVGRSKRLDPLNGGTMTPRREESTPGIPWQSIGNRGWDPRPLLLATARWVPAGPWCPPDPDEFTRGWDAAGEEGE